MSEQDEQKIKARLREEYFDFLPEIRRLAQQLEAEIRFYTLHILHSLRPYEQLVIRSRVKECESTIKTLQGEKDGRVFDLERADEYSVRSLPDLAGVRILAFPNHRLLEIDETLRQHFNDWMPKPLKDASGVLQAYKYFGHRQSVSREVKGEYQIVPMLLGLFWEVEHSAMYKFPVGANSENMKRLRADVERSLAYFEEGIASLLPNHISNNS